MSRVNHKRMLGWTWVLLCVFFLAFCTRFYGQDWKEKLSFAESQHMIILADIEEGKFDEVLPELRKIIDLKFPEKYEDRLTEEIYIVSDRLRHKDQENLALQVLDEGLRAVSIKKNKARLYKEKGYIYNRQRNMPMAKEMFRKAAELESK